MSDVEIKAVEEYLRSLQMRICSSLEDLDGTAKFQPDRWDRPGGGGGESRAGRVLSSCVRDVCQERRCGTGTDACVVLSVVCARSCGWRCQRQHTNTHHSDPLYPLSYSCTSQPDHLTSHTTARRALSHARLGVRYAASISLPSSPLERSLLRGSISELEWVLSAEARGDKGGERGGSES